jgi:citrate synthase
MKIGKATIARTSICTSDEHTIVVRGKDLSKELIGKISFVDHFFLLVTGRMPSAGETAVLNATLVAIAEHGLVPSVQAARMTFAAAPDAMQGAVAAGVLGCGTVVLGSSETAGRMYVEVDTRLQSGLAMNDAALAVMKEWRAAGKSIPGYGHPLHKERDERVGALFDTARAAGTSLHFVEIAEACEAMLPEVLKKDLKLNVSGAIPAVLLGAGFPVQGLKGVPILARTAGLIAHLVEEIGDPIGFALSYQATREVDYQGTVPASFGARSKSGAT